jgi:hypothetical protein
LVEESEKVYLPLVLSLFKKKFLLDAVGEGGGGNERWIPKNSPYQIQTNFFATPWSAANFENVLNNC